MSAASSDLSELPPIDWSPTPLGRAARAPGASLRVAVIGKRNHLHWDEHVAEAFVDAGCDVRHYQVNRRPALVAGARAAMRLLGGERGARRADALHAARLHRELSRFRPAVVVCVSVFFLPLAFLRAARALQPAPLVVGWDGDALVRFPAARDYVGLVDLLGTTERSLIETGRALFPEACYLPYATNPRVYREQGLQRSARVYFCGARTGPRAELVARLERAPVTVRGPGWTANDAVSAQVRIRPGKVSMLEQARDYASHLAVWNQHQEANNPLASLNMRDFEAPGAGALLVSDQRAHMGEHFEVGDEVVIYREPGELDELLVGIVADPRQSARRALRAMRRVLAHETYRHRARAILEAL